MYIRVNRDLARDLREVIEDEIHKSGGQYTSAIIARRVVERLREEDPELLTKYLAEHAVQVVRTVVTALDASVRTRARVLSIGDRQSVFRGALERHEKGDERALAPWLNTVYVVTTDNQRKPLKDMSKEDLQFVAQQYTERARENALQASFLNALAERVGALTVGDVYDDEQLARMWRSLT